MLQDDFSHNRPVCQLKQIFHQAKCVKEAYNTNGSVMLAGITSKTDKLNNEGYSWLKKHHATTIMQFKI